MHSRHLERFFNTPCIRQTRASRTPRANNLLPVRSLGPTTCSWKQGATIRRSPTLIALPHLLQTPHTPVHFLAIKALPHKAFGQSPTSAALLSPMSCLNADACTACCMHVRHATRTCSCARRAGSAAKPLKALLPAQCAAQESMVLVKLAAAPGGRACAEGLVKMHCWTGSR